MRLHCIRFALITGLAATASLLQSAPPLTSLVPADAPVVLHVRSVPELRKNWDRTSFARAWADPEIRKFFAPTLEEFGEGPDSLPALFEKSTGLSMAEFFDLFGGEAILAIKDFTPYVNDRAESDPQVIVAIESGDSADKLKAALATSREDAEKRGEQEVEEEFQGETMHVTVRVSEEDGSRTESAAWALVDGVFLMGEPKSVLQEAIVALKRGGLPGSIASNPAFASVYRKTPDTHLAMHVGLESIVRPLIAMAEASEGRTDAEGNPTGFAAQLAKIGLTPGGFFQTLGLDALRSLGLSVTFGERETLIEGGISWSERRGLLRMFAYGQPPIPQPDFVPESWVYAGVTRFSIPEMYRAIMQTLAELSPMLDGMVRQQMKNVSTQLGFDVERDFIDSFGDILVQGYGLPDGPRSPQAGAFDQFVAISLSNPDAMRGVIDTILGATPAGGMLQSREYLGETVRSMATPDGQSFAFAITRSHLLISIGGAGMLESAIQGMDGGAARPFWRKSEVAGALQSLPDGASAVNVADLGRMMVLAVDFLAEHAVAGEGDGEEGEEVATSPMPFRVDASARPSDETLRKYWSTMAQGLYLESNGFRYTLKMAHGR